LNTPVGQQIYARQQMLKYLANMKLSGPGTAVLALGNDLSVLQDFTTDPKMLATAVQDYVGGRTALDVESPKIDIPVTTGPGGGAPAAANVSVAGPNSGDYAASVASQTNVLNSFMNLAESLKRFDKNVSVENQDVRIRNTLSAMRTIARAVSGYPGRKSLLWFSAGFPFSLALDESMDLEFSKSYRDQIRDTAALLSDINVAVYPIDTHGLLSVGGLSDPSTATKMGNAAEAGPATSLVPEISSKFNLEASMDHIAADTGGKVFRNTNDLAGALEAAIKDSDSYYVFGYYPERKKWDGKFHTIKVVPNNKQLKVRTRSGYYAVDPANWRKGEDPKELVSTAPVRALAATGVVFYAHAVIPEKKGQPVTVELIVDSSTISYGSGVEGTYSTNLEFQVGAFTPEGHLEKLESQAAEADLRRETFAQFQKTGIPVKMEISLKPGRYLLRVAARDNRNGNVGSLDMPLTVN
jgi:VWFA-related protein